MKKHLEQLSHQEDAIKAIMDAMQGCRDIDNNTDVYANPNISVKSGIDVKMETGTGKTYVYTRMMFEMFQKYGINKFIIFVPSLAIKEGTKSFITADYSRQHFSELYENMHIDLDVINAGDFNTKKGRKTIPSALMDFLEGTRNDHKSIKCLLLNDAMLTSKSMTRDDYDQTLINSCSCPIESIKMTRPVVIIDEPHRFNKNGKAWTAIQQLKPQLIVRFGATFPMVQIGTGRNKVIKKDYDNLVYDLNAIRAFNENLVKGINVLFPEIDAVDAAYKYKVKSVSDKKLVLNDGRADYELKIGDKLPADFEGGLTYEGKKVLSNDLELSEGMVLIPKLFSCSYQELLLNQAINAHFMAERENWIRENSGVNPARIKTLSLFFIDDIKSYRSDDGWLKLTFERLLRKKLTELIEKETVAEYKQFLQESLNHIPETHGGYFAEDTDKTGDEAIQAEVDDILRSGQKLLQFKDASGNWILRRFLFSKWTLREGWDNTNVFTITKLRTSGSENSKIQEVGRGLRLPVDETGKRLSDDDFRLNFIVDWSEKEFAEKLRSEINGDGGVVDSMKITDVILNALVSRKYADNTAVVKAKLLIGGIIDTNDAILKVEELLKLLPEQFQLKKNAIVTNQVGKSVIKLRKNNWMPLKELWGRVVRRYMIKYDNISADDLLEMAKGAVEDSFTPAFGRVKCYMLEEQEGQMIVKSTIVDTRIPLDRISYGLFIQKLSRRTQVAVNIWHQAMCEKYPNGLKSDDFNVQSLENIINKFLKSFADVFAQRFEYSSLEFTANTSLIKNGEFVDEVPQGALGTHLAEDVCVESCYMYDKKCYDTEPEHEILKLQPHGVVTAFGKLPRRSIKVPLYTGGTTSPDFVYAIESDNGVKLNLLVEVKADNERRSDSIITKSQQEFFRQIKGVEWRKVVKADDLRSAIEKLV